MKNYLKKTAMGIAGLLCLANAQSALALGTASGTTISNTASVDYTVGGVNQDDVNSNNVQFVVDRKITVIVAELGGTATTVVPGSTNQVTTFTVSNTSNAPLDFRLGATQDASATALPFGGTDNFDGTNVRVFVDNPVTGTVGSYDAGDTQTFMDEIPANGIRTVFVLTDIASNRANGDRAGVTLTATAAESGTAGTLGTDSTQTAGADSPTIVDTVFADIAGDTDGARSGSHSDDDQYNVATASIAVTKTATVISDPFNLGVNPKAIPGAIIEYCIQVANTGGAAATSINVTDGIPANTTYIAGSIFAGATVTGGVCNADGTSEDDDTAGADESDPNSGSFSANTVFSTVPSVAAASTTATRFRVQLN
jgi:uncharacterized repeat protein (TIGR01451 family)